MTTTFVRHSAEYSFVGEIRWGWCRLFVMQTCQCIDLLQPIQRPRLILMGVGMSMSAAFTKPEDEVFPQSISEITSIRIADGSKFQ